MQLWEYYHQHSHRVVQLPGPTKYGYGDTMTNTTNYVTDMTNTTMTSECHHHHTTAGMECQDPHSTLM